MASECDGGKLAVDNPLFADLSYNPEDPNALPAPARPQNLVFFAGIVGVPWQDIAVDADPSTPLVYLQTASDDPETQTVNWSWVIGERYPADGIPAALDPLMRESIEPRTGVVPATGESLAPPTAAFDANSINGHEWEASGTGDLQYACVFPLEEPQDCLAVSQLDALAPDEEASIPNCDCSEVASESFGNPLCQQPDGSYGLTQTRAKAYPSLRQLQALHDYGQNAIVASICPKSNDPALPDYGYRPAVRTIIDRLKGELLGKCYPRQLATRRDGSVACVIVEATRDVEAGCNRPARSAVTEDVAKSVRKRLLTSSHCTSQAECDAMQLCEIQQLTPEQDAAALLACQNQEHPTGDGWCYIDEQLGIGNPELLGACPNTARRKVRYVGTGQPEPDSVTIVSCAGATFDD